LQVQSVIPAQSVAPMVSAPPAQAAVEVLVEQAAVLARAGAGGLLGCFAAIDDPRDRRGIRHSLPTILGLCTAAATSGQVLLADITAWISAAVSDQNIPHPAAQERPQVDDVRNLGGTTNAHSIVVPHDSRPPDTAAPRHDSAAATAFGRLAIDPRGLHKPYLGLHAHLFDEDRSTAQTPPLTPMSRFAPP
jgi:hypothetical protein